MQKLFLNLVLYLISGPLVVIFQQVAFIATTVMSNTITPLPINTTTSLNDYSEPWGINTMKGIMRGQNIKMRIIYKSKNPYSTCYEAECQGTHCPPEGSHEKVIEFCYPAVIVTGMPKCGTSAMYDMLTRLPGAIVMHEKENCPYARRRPHWQFFNSLPKASVVGATGLVVDGCIEAEKNIIIRSLLRQPKTLYIVMVRNFADMLWSSYNFWCKREYDNDCDSTHWTKPGKHVRSPQLFHEIILGDKNGTLVHSPVILKKPCWMAEAYYTEYLEYVIWKSIPRNQTLVLASELLERDPRTVWNRVTTALNVSFGNLSSQGVDERIRDFSSYRYNTQESWKSFDKMKVPSANYKPGLFAVSNFQPLMPETRTLLDWCWRKDCKYITNIIGFSYEACNIQSMSNDLA